jgi:hypothetical protein
MLPQDKRQREREREQRNGRERETNLAALLPASDTPQSKMPS